MPLKDDLLKLIKGEILDNNETLTKYSKDASIFEIRPSVVVYPKDSEDIKSLVKFVTQNKDLSLTVRSAGTDMSGGAINDSIILDMTKYFNQILEIGADFITTQPGVYYKNIEMETLKSNLLFPSYPASKDICTIGGIVANNSAGEKTLSYGQTKDYVKFLKVILSDGEEYEISALTKFELDKKLVQNNFEAQIYQQIYRLITDNFDLIKNAKPKVHKNSAGYFLWDVWDENIFDLTKLIVGSQGTLGIITQINLKLIKPNPCNSLLVINLDNLNNLDKIINQVLKFNPQAFEVYDDQTIEYALKFLPELLIHFRLNNPIEIFAQFNEERQAQDNHRLPKLTLLAQFADQTEAKAYQKASLAEKSLTNLNVKTKLITNDKQAEKYWVIRHESFNMLRHHATHMRTAPFIDDIIVSPIFLPQFLPKLKEILVKYQEHMLYTIAGHIGEGNFHIIPLLDLGNKDSKQKIVELLDKVNDLVLEFKGSLTAEHNDGLIRGPYLEKSFGPDMYQLFKNVKQIFDPQNIFNPHKKTDATFKYSFNHMIKS